MVHQQLPQFNGVSLLNESSDEPVTNLRRADNILLLPRGGFSRPWPQFRLWGLPNLKSYASVLGVGPADGGCALLIRNEGLMFIAFYDYRNNESLGWHYAGHDPESEFAGPATFTVGGATVALLWKGLTSQCRWNGVRAANRVFMGNGVDANLTFESQTLTIRPMADAVRPLAPNVSAVDPAEIAPASAILQAQNVIFYGLEDRFQPVVTNEAPYARARGNYIAVSVVQSLGGATGFSSGTTGVGTAIDPFIYTVYTPEVLPSEEELINFVNRDPNAQGLVSAELIGTASIVRLFPPALLSGGVTSFAPGDVFAGPVVAVALTYAKLGENELVSETMPGPVVTAQSFANGRISVTVCTDTVASTAATYDTIRIYVADLSDGKKTFAPDDYSNFQYALEVPNLAGSYTIAPSMLSANKSLPIETRTPPPCSMFILSNNRLVMSGNDEHPMRVWFAAQPATGQLLPEGVGLYTWQDFQPQTPDDRVAAISTYRTDTMAYTKTTAWPMFGSTNKFTLISGALNSSVIATWTNGVQYFLGQDYRLYSLAQPQFTADSIAPDCDIAAPQISDYIARFCDPTDYQVAHSLIDPINKHWWLWLRGSVGNVQGFVYDFDTAQMTGPIDFPQFFAADRVDEDTHIAGLDLAGNPLAIDTKIGLSITENYANDAGLTPLPATTSFDASSGDGMSYVALPDNTFIRDGQLLRLQTVYTHFGRPDRLKTFYELRFSVVEGSAGLVYFYIQNEKGQGIFREFGEVFGQLNPRIGFMLTGALIQVLFLVVAGEGRPFAIRDFTLGYAMVGNN